MRKWATIVLVLGVSVGLVADPDTKSSPSAPPNQAVPGIKSKQRLTILSANDGDVHLRSNPDGNPGPKKVTADSITVIHLGPDHPPIVKTVYGTVPNTISGAPYMAMTATTARIRIE